MRGRGPAPPPQRESLGDHIGKLATAAALAVGIYHAGKHHAAVSSGINRTRAKLGHWGRRTANFVTGGTESTGPFEYLQPHGTPA